MTSAFQPKAIGQANEVVGRTRLSTKPTLSPCDPGVVSWSAKIFVLVSGLPK